MKTVGVLDYGVGNLGSVVNAVQILGYPVEIVATSEAIHKVSILIVPGQGAIGDAMACLSQNGLGTALKQYIQADRPFLGICLGLQLLFEWSEEDGGCAGLGIFPGQVRRFDSNLVKLPQMGWNQIDIQQDTNGWMRNLPEQAYVYFANSYYVTTPQEPLICTTTSYGKPFISSIQTKNVLGIQFHPEKSGQVGMTVLKQFLETFE